MRYIAKFALQFYFLYFCIVQPVPRHSSDNKNDSNPAGLVPSILELPRNSSSNDRPAEKPKKGELSTEKPITPKTRNKFSKIVLPSENDDNPLRNSRRSGVCGTIEKSRTRLVGGEPSDPSAWPWMAALLRHDFSQYCGGVLITDRHVLTAAHCVYRYSQCEIIVRLGQYDFSRVGETRTLDFAVIEIRIHRNFDHTSYENDIAIVKTHQPTIFNRYIWPVCLPPIEETFENKSAIATGWGSRYFGGPASTVLMEVSVVVWPQEDCRQTFPRRIFRTTICAGVYRGGRDACQGDSGGPLLHQLENGRWINIGIISWGLRCGEAFRPGIYTRVNSYLDWISANALF